MSTCGIRSMYGGLIQLEADAGYCKVLSTDSRPLIVGGECGRVDMLASKKKRSSPFCQTENASAQSVKGFFHHHVYIQTSVSLWYKLILPSICSRTKFFIRKSWFDCILLVYRTN